MKLWQACPRAKSKHCATRRLQQASWSQRSAPLQRGRGGRAFSVRTVHSLCLRGRRSAISEHLRPARPLVAFGAPPADARASFRCYNETQKGECPMHDTTALVRSAEKDYTPVDNPRFLKLHRRFPTIAYLRQHARSHVASFAFEYMDGGAGGDGGIARNWNAFDAIELVPRSGVTVTLPPVDVELFGRRYSAPIGIAPMGGPSIVWPGADQYLAGAAQRARVPYTLGLVGGMTVERAAEIAPDVLWFQLYRCFRNEHAIGFDLVRRAEAVGVHVLVLTADVPVRTTRPREVAVGITSPFRPDLRMLAGILTSPGYLKSLWKHGQPRFGNLKPYTADTADVDEVAAFVRREMGG